MAKHIRLIDAFEDLPRYGQITLTPVDYHPTYGSKILNGKMAETEEFHHWYAVMFKDELYFVSAEVSKFELRFEAEDNTDWLSKAIQCQENYSKLYENSELLTKGVPATKEFLEELPVFLQQAYANCWLTDTTEWCGHTGLTYLRQYTSKKRFGQKYFIPDYDFIVPNSSSGHSVKSFLPIVKAHKNTLVSLEREFDYPYTIKLPQII